MQKTSWEWNLPCKLVLAESQDVASYFSHDLALILGPAVLQNVLDDVVPILVLNQTKPHILSTKMRGGQLGDPTSHRTLPDSENPEAQSLCHPEQRLLFVYVCVCVCVLPALAALCADGAPPV